MENFTEKEDKMDFGTCDEPEDVFNPPPTPINDGGFMFHRALMGERKRVRTESLCSNKSTAIAKDLQKIRRPDETKPSGRNIPNRAAILKKEKSMLTMKDMIYYNPRSNPMSKPLRSNEGSPEVKIKTEIKEERSKTPPPEFDPPKSMIPIVPQLKLGPNGEIILDEKSLVIESTADREAKKLRESSEVVFDDGSNGKYGYFKRQKRTKDWSPEETIRFYRCLHTVGTDFSLMLQLFPNRNRRDLKIKFKKEEKTNGHLIDKALLYPKEFDIDALRREFEEEDAEKAEQEANQIEKVTKEKKLLRKKKRDELKEMKKAAPQKVLSRTAKQLTEAETVYSLIDEDPLKRKKPERVQRLSEQSESQEFVETSSLNSITPYVIKSETEETEYTISFVPETSQTVNEAVEQSSEDHPTENIGQVEKSIRSPDPETLTIDNEDIDLNQLVVCSVQEANGGVTYQVYLSDPKTGDLSKEPLDLPPETVEILIENMK